MFEIACVSVDQHLETVTNISITITLYKLEHLMMIWKDTKSNEDGTKAQIQSQVMGQNSGQLISGQETLVLPVDTKVLNADLSTIIKQNPNAKVYVVVPRQVNNQLNKETTNWKYKQGSKTTRLDVFKTPISSPFRCYWYFIIGVIYRCPSCGVLSVITFFGF